MSRFDYIIKIILAFFGMFRSKSVTHQNEYISMNQLFCNSYFILGELILMNIYHFI